MQTLIGLGTHHAPPTWVAQPFCDNSSLFASRDSVLSLLHRTRLYPSPRAADSWRVLTRVYCAWRGPRGSARFLRATSSIPPGGRWIDLDHFGTSQAWDVNKMILRNILACLNNLDDRCKLLPSPSNQAINCC